MVGVRQFDEDEALDRIEEAFWRGGYRATSIDDLVAATGLKRGSLYAAFGDKTAMFLKAYDRYLARSERTRLALLDDPDIGRAITGLFADVLAGLTDPATPPGCLVALTIGEAAGRGDAIEAAARETYQGAEALLHDRLRRAQADGQIGSTEDTLALARFFAGVLRVLAPVHRLTGDDARIRDIVTVALQRLDAARPDPGRPERS